MFTKLEFLEAMKQFPTIVEEPAEYRFHYDDAGRITMCTARQHPENTQYVVVDHETYDNYFRYYIKDGKPKLVDIGNGFRVQLTSSNQGYAVVKQHAGLILEEGENWTEVEYYESNS